MARYKQPVTEQYRIVTLNFADLFPPEHPIPQLLATIRRLNLEKFDAGYENGGDEGGRPAYPADRMLALIIYSLLYGNLSMRHLERDIGQRADLMYLSGGLEIDHSTLGKFRKRHADAIREVFTQTVFLGVEAGLIDLDIVCIDSTKIKASANRRDIGTKEELEKRFVLVEESCKKRHAEWEAETDEEARKTLEQKKSKLEKTKAKLQQGIDFLKSHTERKRVHLTDADADWHKESGNFIVGYSAQTAVDAASGMVVHAEVVTGQADSDYTTNMVGATEKVKEDILPEKSSETKYVLDCGYASEANLEKLSERDIYMPDRDFARENLGGKIKPEERAESQKQAAASAETALKFEYSASSNTFKCPKNKTLSFKREKKLKGVLYSHFAAGGCRQCPLHDACAGVNNSRKHLWIRSADLAGMKIKWVARQGEKSIKRLNTNPLTLSMREKLSTPEGKKIYAKRFAAIEGTFGVIKNARQGWHFLRRRLERVQVEWAERLIAHNLAKLIGFRRNDWQHA